MNLKKRSSRNIDDNCIHQALSEWRKYQVIDVDIYSGEVALNYNPFASNFSGNSQLASYYLYASRNSILLRDTNVR